MQGKGRDFGAKSEHFWKKPIMMLNDFYVGIISKGFIPLLWPSNAFVYVQFNSTIDYMLQLMLDGATSSCLFGSLLLS